MARHFTLEEANKAIPYVAKIMADIQSSFCKAVELQTKIENGSDKDKDEYNRTISNVNRYVDELDGLGVHLRDYEAGIVDFPSTHQGRQIELRWTIGQNQIVSWHELKGGARSIAQLVG
jgi:hypothetical protein